MSRRLRTVSATSFLVALLVVSACHRPAPDRIVTLGVPDHINQTPGIAADGPLVAVSWAAINSESIADAYVAVSHDEGATFAAPVRVNDVAGEVRPSEQQAPRIAIHAGTVAVLWTSRRGADTQLRLAVSRDQGRSFGASQSVSPDGAPGMRGWGSLMIDDTGQIHVLWLDTRVSAAADPSQAGPHVHGSATKSETRQDVYEATIGVDGRVAERLVATAVCFCCKTAIVNHGGFIWGAWRDVYPVSVRDMTAARLAPGSKIVRVRVSEDHWKIEGCPEDGPALASGADGALNIVWPTLSVTEPVTKGVFHARSTDGQKFSTRVRLDDGQGSASHPVIAASPSGALLAAWDVTEKSARHIAVREWRDGDWQPIVALTSGASASSPSVAALPHGFIAAWGRRSDPESAIEVRRISSGIR